MLLALVMREIIWSIMYWLIINLSAWKFSFTFHWHKHIIAILKLKAGGGVNNLIFDPKAWDQEYLCIVYDYHLKLFDILICDCQVDYAGYLGGLDVRTKIYKRNMVQILFDIFIISVSDLDYIFCVCRQNILWIWRKFEFLKYLATRNNDDDNNDSNDNNKRKIMVGKLLHKKCNYSMSNGRTLFKGQ